MEYLYVIVAFIFVTIVALVLKSKRDKQAKEMKIKGDELVMEEQIKAAAEIEARKKAAQLKK